MFWADQGQVEHFGRRGDPADLGTEAAAGSLGLRHQAAQAKAVAAIDSKDPTVESTRGVMLVPMSNSVWRLLACSKVTPRGTSRRK